MVDAVGMVGRLRTSRRRLAAVSGVLGGAAVVTAVVAGHPGLAMIWGLAVIVSAVGSLFAGPPELLGISEDALRLRIGRHTRTIRRADVLDVQPRYGVGYGLVLSVRDDDPIELSGTAPRFSVAAEQAAAVRRWAGLVE